MMDEWQRRMKEEKEKERSKQKESAEMLQGYRGNEIREEDKKLKAMKEEERKKQQETAKILQGYRSSGISEEERKLKAMKEEERKKQQEAESLLHSFKKTEEPEAKSRPQRKEEHSYPEPVNKSPSQQNDIMYISPGSVAEKKKSYSSQYQPSGPDLPVLPMAKNLQNAPFMEIVDEEETQGDMNGYNNTVGDEATEEMIDPETEITEIPKKDELQTEIEATVSSAESETEERVDEDTSKDNSTVNKEEENAEKTDASMGLDNVEERFDVCFSFGIVTDKDSPLLTTYMGAVNAVMKESIPKADPSSSIRYDPTHQPYVIDEKLDNNYADPRNRADIRRVLITAAVPLKLSNGASKEKAQQIATSALADAIRSQAFLKFLTKE